MNTSHILSFQLFLVILGAACTKTDTYVSIKKETVNNHYLGNGAQWDPYQEDYGIVQLKVSDEDWSKIYSRLDFMRPQLMRVMVNSGNYFKNGKLAFDPETNQLTKILEYCQKNEVQVMFGDWGWGTVDASKNQINEAALTNAANLVNYLVSDLGYTSIKYYNLINEPNGYWSTTEGNYELWADAIGHFYGKMEQLGLNKQVKIVGPDAAIWTSEEAWWVDSIATQMPEKVGLYDIHTYPSKITVNSGEYGNIIAEYKNRLPEGAKIVMAEIGFKFVEPEDSLLWQENIRRAEVKPYASTDDSQMFVYDYSYGIDMADALFQTVNAGYSGSIVWMLDDAMYSREARHKLKVWGFWNILGDEFFGKEEEVVRPWFYAWSLLTKYMPAGSQVYNVETKGDASVKAIAVQKDGRYMVAIVNVSDEMKHVHLDSDFINPLSSVQVFEYAEGKLLKEGDHKIKPNTILETLDFSNGVDLELREQTLMVYTNFDY